MADKPSTFNVLYNQYQTWKTARLVGGESRSLPDYLRETYAYAVPYDIDAMDVTKQVNTLAARWGLTPGKL